MALNHQVLIISLEMALNHQVLIISMEMALNCQVLIISLEMALNHQVLIISMEMALNHQVLIISLEMALNHHVLVISLVICEKKNTGIRSFANMLLYLEVPTDLRLYIGRFVAHSEAISRAPARILTSFTPPKEQESNSAASH